MIKHTLSWKTACVVLSGAALGACSAPPAAMDAGDANVPREASADATVVMDGAVTDAVVAMDGAAMDGDDGATPPDDVVLDVTCSLGLVSCSGACVDLNTSESNCGVCGRGCAMGEVCESGACRTPCNSAAGEMRCGDTCVNTTANAMNCGGCGRACGALERCELSSCVSNCPMAGQIPCGMTCVDTRTDNGNCGGCGRACGASERCTSGMCQPICAMGQSFCSGMCANLQTDRANCGACGRACPMGQMCSMGVCAVTCTLPTMACGGVCVDTTTSAANCGMCGRACATAPNATPSCAMSVCGITCAMGFGNCDAMAANGCETDTRTAMAHCGACGRACVAGPNQTATCATSVCSQRCNVGFGDCDGMAANGCETNTVTSATHCGACGRACTAPAGGSVTCVSSACVGACAMGQSICGASAMSAGRCVNLQTDRTNCGTCGTACPGTQSCVAGRCQMVCPAGQTACGAAMTCVDTSTSAANCGACGRACAMGQSCVSGACLSNFQITGLTTATCTATAVGAAGDQRGALAVTVNNVVSVGDSASVRASNTTGTGPAVVSDLLDGLVTDLATGTAYVLGTASGPIRAGAGAIMVDRLFRVDAARVGWIPTGAIVLSAPVAVNTSTGATSPVGIYNGSGRVVVHSADRVSEIVFATGTVVDRGMLSQVPRTPSEGWATWGVAQLDAGRLYLTYIQSNSTIARIRVPDAVVETVATFADIGDASGFVVVPSLNRWFFSFEGTSQVGGTGAVSEFIASCPATFVTSAGDFRITSLSAVMASCTVVDVTAAISDDRAGIAVHNGRVVVTGDAATASVPMGAFLAANVAQSSPPADHLFSDLATGQLYGLFVGALPLYGGAGTQVVDRIVPLNENTLQPAGAAITLSAALNVNTASPASTMLLSGHGRAMLVNNGRATNVELPSGVVRDFGAVILPAHTNSESWASWGVVETALPSTRLVFIENTMRVSRFTLGGVTISPIATFTNLGASGSFAFSPLRMRWFVESKGSNQYLGVNPPGEYLLSCPATFSLL